MSRRWAVAIAMSLLAVSSASTSQSDEPKRGRDIIMQQKLSSAQKLRTGNPLLLFLFLHAFGDHR